MTRRTKYLDGRPAGIPASIIPAARLAAVKAAAANKPRPRKLSGANTAPETRRITTMTDQQQPSIDLDALAGQLAALDERQRQQVISKAAAKDGATKKEAAAAAVKQYLGK